MLGFLLCFASFQLSQLPLLPFLSAARSSSFAARAWPRAWPRARPLGNEVAAGVA
ncbi:uncharacterized protein J3R85_020624 [Psidium guajava]|nr:uncharacterized protein J3R85_020624 [Psidium guajava]